MLPTTHPFASDPSFLAAALHRTLNRIADEAYAPTGLSSSQAYVLYLIVIEPNHTPSRLAKRLSMDASTVTRLVEPFVRRGWVSVSVNGREKRLSPTDAGQDKVREISRAMQAHRDRISGILGPDHARVLSGLLLATLGGVVSATGTI